MIRKHQNMTTTAAKSNFFGTVDKQDGRLSRIISSTNIKGQSVDAKHKHFISAFILTEQLSKLRQIIHHNDKLS